MTSILLPDAVYYDSQITMDTYRQDLLLFDKFFDSVDNGLSSGTQITFTGGVLAETDVFLTTDVGIMPLSGELSAAQSTETIVQEFPTTAAGGEAVSAPVPGMQVCSISYTIKGIRLTAR
jgi:hypothetical protein